MELKRFVPKPATEATYEGGKRLTTTRGKIAARLVMRVKFYDHFIDPETGEVHPKQWCYRGDEYKKLYARKNNIFFPNEITALFYHLYRVQKQCWEVVVFDNDKPMKENEIFRMEYGVVIDYLATAARLRLNYELQVRQFIPNYKFFPHQKPKA